MAKKHAEVISLADFREAHHPGYLRGLYLDAWSAWSNGINPLTKEDCRPQKTRAWSKEECDKREVERRRKENEQTKKRYKIT